jgi:hypothetical protein
LLLAVGSNVDDVPALIEENAPDKESPMTARRVLFAAHQRDVVALPPGQKAFETVMEERSFRDLPVKDVPFRVVEIRSRRAPAELLSEKDVAEALRVELVLKILTGEVRGVLGVGLRPRVHDDLDVVRAEEVAELLEGQIRMPHGKDGSYRGPGRRMVRSAGDLHGLFPFIHA